MSLPTPLHIILAMNVSLRNKKAHSLQIMHMAEAFAETGAKTTLLVPAYETGSVDQLFDEMGIAPIFTLKELPTAKLRNFGRIGHLLDELWFTLCVAVYANRQRRVIPTLFTRSILLAAVLGVWRPVILEIHGIPNSFKKLTRRATRLARFVVITTAWKQSVLETDFQVPKEKIIILPNGVSVADFDLQLEPRSVREQLQLPTDCQLLGYTGHLYPWKGVDVAIEALEYLPETVHLVIVGGTDEAIEEYRERYQQFSCRVHFLGHKPHKDVPRYLQAMDVLLLPLVPMNHSARYEASPLKLFEYMASRRPVVTSDSPAILEVVDDTVVEFSAAGDPKDTARAITFCLAKSEQVNSQTVAAYHLVSQRYTWTIRAKNILHYYNGEAKYILNQY